MRSSEQLSGEKEISITLDDFKITPLPSSASFFSENKHTTPSLPATIELKVTPKCIKSAIKQVQDLDRVIQKLTEMKRKGIYRHDPQVNTYEFSAKLLLLLACCSFGAVVFCINGAVSDHEGRNHFNNDFLGANNQTCSQTMSEYSLPTKQCQSDNSFYNYKSYNISDELLQLANQCMHLLCDDYSKPFNMAFAGIMLLGVTSMLCICSGSAADKRNMRLHQYSNEAKNDFVCLSFSERRTLAKHNIDTSGTTEEMLTKATAIQTKIYLEIQPEDTVEMALSGRVAKL